jgi:hypothetical protein
MEEDLSENLSIELVPDLSNCIETVAKREYQKTVNSLLSNDEVNDELKEKMEILRLFLEGTDFRKLRSESEEYLVRGKRVTFKIYLESGKIQYEMHSRL